MQDSDLDLSDISGALDTAIECHQSGLTEEAEELYRAILRQCPEEPEALNLLGVILQERGELTESIALIQRAAAADADYAEAHANLARALRATGQAKAAVASARRAIALDPELAEAHLTLGRALLDLQEDTEAAASCRAAIKLNLTLPGAHATLGNALRRLNELPGAIQAYRFAAEADPEDAAVATALGLALSESLFHDEALQWHRRAIELAPDNVSARSTLALALGHAKLAEESIAACREALELAPDSAGLWTMLGSQTANLGRFEEAATYQRKALEIDPNCVEATRELAAIRQHLPDAIECQALSAVIHDESRQLRERSAAGFALGSALDRLGDYDAAFEAFAAANALAREESRQDNKMYDMAALDRGVKWATRVFGQATYLATRSWGNPSELPVFVVGIPRSGTSLVEQIAASHKSVFGAGELRDFVQIFDRLQATAKADTPTSWLRDVVRHEADSYVARLQALAPQATRVIDKLPDNIQLLGSIAVLLPKARIIVCRRDLRDVGLSCFMQRFSDNVTWSNDLAEFAERARQIDRLVAHWKKVVPIQILEVQYETLVGDLDGESRRIIDFLGLDWDPACLEFDKTERAIHTASRWQVRQPLYTTSVGKWRKYRAHLGPLLDGLKGLVADDAEASI